ncbi:ABC transporter ATP-binding protein [Thalassotalea euphylliae]|uniref:ABC transporter ATP-binding protein n=1 Tax=Thalassotalea euphylliae TaxID=1655234 RepID=UPI003625AC30
MTDKFAIEVSGLNAFYDERQILFDINFSVQQGEILVIMGGSGSGKSTLLNNLLGLLTPKQGSISIDGVDVINASDKDIKSLRQKMGVAFQGGALLSSLSVEDNIKLPLQRNTNLDAATISVMTQLKLELMNLAGFGKHMPSELSGGMLKRAGLARAVIMDPKILFFDEPSAGLDPIMSVELDELLLSLREAMGMSMIIVTHELESAFKIADKVLVLFEGKIAAYGAVDDIKNSTDERIQNLIHRRPRKDDIDGDEYLKRLTNG